MTDQTPLDPGKAPAYQWYPRDALSDMLLLSDTEELIYRRLLDYQWLHGEVPSSPQLLARSARVSRAKAVRAWTNLASLFPQRGPDGGWQNRRMERDRARLAEFKENRAASGKAGAARRWKGHKTGPSTDKEGHGTANGTAIAQPMTQGMAKNGPASASASARKAEADHNNNNPPLTRDSPPWNALSTPASDEAARHAALEMIRAEAAEMRRLRDRSAAGAPTDPGEAA